MSDDEETALSEVEQWQNFMHVFCLAASFQGRFAYFLMSIHACNPHLFTSWFGFDPYEYLWVTMLYGIAVMIFARPTFKVVSTLNRLAFAILGSLMFNHASMHCFNWLYSIYPERPILRTFMGFFSGRIMMVHFLAFLYHMDTRTNTPGAFIQRDIAFEQMYIRPAQVTH